MAARGVEGVAEETTARHSGGSCGNLPRWQLWIFAGTSGRGDAPAEGL